MHGVAGTFEVTADDLPQFPIVLDHEDHTRHDFVTPSAIGVPGLFGFWTARSASASVDPYGRGLTERFTLGVGNDGAVSSSVTCPVL
ncbi:hypothetical protein Aca07nite_67760 [Actinoplanes capillaceus]|uniref:Uncharacterized protein n=1 Tax=Actinoplanes campanulatus TaxID=113559 RepID=A0ABQ3WT90_9ACTN|nr:hypothetical protein Aca07nite_67760 [Actinoplanes capillaceus]